MRPADSAGAALAAARGRPAGHSRRAGCMALARRQPLGALAGSSRHNPPRSLAQAAQALYQRTDGCRPRERGEHLQFQRAGRIRLHSVAKDRGTRVQVNRSIMHERIRCAISLLGGMCLTAGADWRPHRIDVVHDIERDDESCRIQAARRRQSVAWDSFLRTETSLTSKKDEEQGEAAIVHRHRRFAARSSAGH